MEALERLERSTSTQRLKMDANPMDEIVTGLFLGGGEAFQDRGCFKSKNMTRFVCCASFCPCRVRAIEGMEVMRLSEDRLQAAIRDVSAVQAWINDGLGKNEGVFVHCSQGQQRSPSLVIAYLMKERKISYEEALALVQEKRPCIESRSDLVDLLTRACN